MVSRAGAQRAARQISLQISLRAEKADNCPTACVLEKRDPNAAAADNAEDRFHAFGLAGRDAVGDFFGDCERGGEAGAFDAEEIYQPCEAVSFGAVDAEVGRGFAAA